MEKIIAVLLLVIGVYFMLGLFFSAAFLTKGIAKVDASTHGASIGFKLLLVPGCTALWPVLLMKWLKSRST